LCLSWERRTRGDIKAKEDCGERELGMGEHLVV